MRGPMSTKTFVVTGASSGLGAALALAYAARNENVVVAARSKAELERVASECERLGGRALAVETDVTDPESCKRLVEAAVATFGRIDVLVNNAGVSMRALFKDITDLGLFDRLMKVNYLGSVYLTHFALPHVVASKGLLVAVSSLTGKTGVPTRTGYAASKHAMQGFFDSLRIELLETGVDVLVASPGFVDTGIRDRALGKDGKPLTADGHAAHTEKGTMSQDECVRHLVRAIDRRDRELVMTSKAKVGLWLKLLAPSLVDRIASSAVKDKQS